MHIGVIMSDGGASPHAADASPTASPIAVEASQQQLVTMLAVAAVGGCCSGLSVNVGSALTQYSGHPLRSSLMLYIVSISAVFVAVVWQRGWTLVRWDLIKSEMRWWEVPLPGILGSSSIAAAVMLIPKIGYASFAVLVVAGQLMTSAAIDHYALLNATQQQFTPHRAGALAVIVVGAVLVESNKQLGGATSNASIAPLWLAALLVGVMPPVQSSFNGQMARRCGSPVTAAFVSFSFGLLNLFIMCVVLQLTNNKLDLALLSQAPLWAFTGGLFGAGYVFTTCLCPGVLGSSLYFACVVCGQLVTAVIIDATKLLPASATELTVLRIVGALLVVLGAVAMHFVRRDEERRRKEAAMASSPQSAS